MKQKRHLKPRFYNWYLFEYYILAWGCGLCVIGRVISWLGGNEGLCDKVACLGMCHLILWCLIYGFTEIFEFCYKRVH